MDKFAELKVQLKNNREKALAVNEHNKQIERMRKKEDRELLKKSKAKLNPVNKQNSSPLSPQSTRNIKINTASSKKNACVRVSDRIKSKISNSDPSAKHETLAPVLKPKPFPSTSGICENIVTEVVNSQSINRKRKRRKLSNKQKELARLRVEKYRRKMTQEKKEEQKVKDNERYQKRKMLNIIKPVSEMTVKEKRLKRKQWRINSKRYYQNKKLKLQSEKFNDCTTISPQMKTARKTLRKKEARVYRENMNLKAQNEKLLKRLRKYEKRDERQNQKHLATSFSPKTQVNCRGCRFYN